MTVFLSRWPGRVRPKHRVACAAGSRTLVQFSFAHPNWNGLPMHKLVALAVFALTPLLAYGQPARSWYSHQNPSIEGDAQDGRLGLLRCRG